MRHVAVALLLGEIAVPAFCQDAQSLVAKNLEARGGEQALAAIKTILDSMADPSTLEISSLPRGNWARTGAEAAGRTDLTIQGLDSFRPMTGTATAGKSIPSREGRTPNECRQTRLGRLPTQRLSRGRCSHREPTGAMSNILAGTISKAL